MKNKNSLWCLLLVWSFAFGSGKPESGADGSVILDRQTVTSSIKASLQILDDHYVFPDIAKAMRVSIEEKLESGAYDQITSDIALIESFVRDLRQVSSDGHISMHVVNNEKPELTHVLPTRDKGEQDNSGFEAVQILDGNIGYLKINKFSGAKHARRAASAAMKKLSSVDGLIIDLTDNHGGDPSLVAYLSAYLLEKNTHLWSILDRAGEPIAESWTPEVALQNGPAPGIPVYILTSSTTYSAAEAFAYTLKHQGRATLFGEVTGGGANLVQMERVNEYFDLRVPVARAFSPITKSNWEGVGVIPHIELPAHQAKAEAIKQMSNLKRLEINRR